VIYSNHFFKPKKSSTIGGELTRGLIYPPEIQFYLLRRISLYFALFYMTIVVAKYLYVALKQHEHILATAQTIVMYKFHFMQRCFLYALAIDQLHTIVANASSNTFCLNMR
jgi:hypothetical protein